VANLNGVNLAEADLIDADLIAAALNAADLSDADLFLGLRLKLIKVLYSSSLTNDARYCAMSASTR